MTKSSPYFSSFVIVVAVTLAAASRVCAQSSLQDELIVQPTAADHYAARAATLRYRHAKAANSAAGRSLRTRKMDKLSASNESSGWQERGAILQYADDVAYGGGQVLKSAVLHAIYLQPETGSQCTIATCWGDPEGFLRDLGNSEFIHDVDQYVGRFGENRYTVGSHATVTYSPQVTPLLDSDIQAMVHAVAAQNGASGYGHIYHVFLPPGQDECFDSSLSECYSPDNLAAFYYCAYHSSVDFPDIGHVIYTVQPNVNTLYCQVQPGTPNGILVDSANNALSHELFESITDPDGDAWTNTDSNLLYGSEIADECEYYHYDPRSGYYLGEYGQTFLIGAHIYAVQLVYSNEQHACSSAP